MSPHVGNGNSEHAVALPISREDLPGRTGDTDQSVLITGGAGFIGCNLAHRILARRDMRVTLFDNLSRAGVERNVAFLRRVHGDRVTLRRGDIRDFSAVQDAVQRASSVFHFAAQVAVTTSLDDVLHDCSVNTLGTLHVIEAIRRSAHRPPLLFTSTNKVYGDLADVPLTRDEARYAPTVASGARDGISEARALSFHSPYGCSKGAADQYVLDASRSFGLRTAVFRMSCIYGAHQFGTEDQGWVAHFLIRALQGKPIDIYGDGRQVRDILHVDDLVEAFLLARRNIDTISGRAFNIGGGAANTVSLLELLDMIRALRPGLPPVAFHDWRVGDQRYYVSDHGRFTEATGWKPSIDVVTGVQRLHAWLLEHGDVERRHPVFLPLPGGTSVPAATRGARERERRT